MFGLGNRSENSQSVNKNPAKSVKYTKDINGSSAVSLASVEENGGVSLRKKTEAVTVSLSKKNMSGVRAQVVVVLDHSGSMSSDYESGKVQDLTERFLGFGLAVDIDGTVPVIPFDSRVKPTVEVNLSNYKNVVKDKIYDRWGMGSTNLAAALKEVRKLAEKTDEPIFCAIVTDGEPDNRAEATELIKDLARYPVFIKFLAVRPVSYLNDLDDMDSNQRLLDNVDTKSYANLSSVSDTEFAEDMIDEWDSWIAAATTAGILTN